MAKLLLTPQVVKTATCPDGKAKSDIFDSNCKGLLLETRRTGGKKRQLKLADERDVTLAQARTLADKHRTQIAMGNDPLQQKTERKQVPKLADFIETNYLPFVKTYKASWKTDEGLLRNHILPAFGHLHLDAVSKSDVIGFISRHRETHKPGSVNRVIILLRYVFNLALKWETPGVSRNPTASIPLLEENNQKERFLTADEAKSLVTAIKQSDNTMLQYIVSALILTGTRKQEVLKARWADFNFDMRIWRIPTSKGGKARHIPISDGWQHYWRRFQESPVVNGYSRILRRQSPMSAFIALGIQQGRLRAWRMSGCTIFGIALPAFSSTAAKVYIPSKSYLGIRKSKRPSVMRT